MDGFVGEVAWWDSGLGLLVDECHERRITRRLTSTALPLTTVATTSTRAITPTVTESSNRPVFICCLLRLRLLFDGDPQLCCILTRKCVVYRLLAAPVVKMFVKSEKAKRGGQEHPCEHGLGLGGAMYHL